MRSPRWAMRKLERFFLKSTLRRRWSVLLMTNQSVGPKCLSFTTKENTLWFLKGVVSICPIWGFRDFHPFGSIAPISVSRSPTVSLMIQSVAIKCTILSLLYVRHCREEATLFFNVRGGLGRLSWEGCESEEDTSISGLVDGAWLL